MTNGGGTGQTCKICRGERVVHQAHGTVSVQTLTIGRDDSRRLLAPVLEGVEHLPRGPFLLVANHSGCLGLAEINSFIACWVERFGGERPIAGYAHPISFTAWPLTWFMKQIGGIPSTYAAAWAFCASRAR